MSSLQTPNHSALPARYRQTWGVEFWERVGHALCPDSSVLDVGGGDGPRIAAERRPDNTHCVGLDLALEELRAAPAGAYDEVVVSDTQVLQPSLAGRFNRIVLGRISNVSDMQAVSEVLYS